MDLEQELIRAVFRAGAPGAAAYVGSVDATYYHGAIGYQQRVPEFVAAQKGTRYDLASLTKVVATTTALLLLRDEGALHLDQSCADFIPLPQFKSLTLRHLLTHTSGLAPLSLWYKEIQDTTGMIARIAERGIEAPPGTRRVYSDLGFILLGRVVEMAARDSLDGFCQRRIFVPLGMTRTGFRPPAEDRVFCAATENCSWRGRIMQGEVHDENAFAMGGVAGHAGLFAPAEDLALYCRALLQGKILAPATLEEMTRWGHVPFYPWQAYGWRVDPWRSGAEGFLRTRTAFGHSGWTGTSLWLDRARGLFTILLSNTPHPDRALRDNKTLRVLFHGAVSERFYPQSTNTHTGLDRLVWDNFQALRGKRIALLTHHAAIDESGRPILDVLRLCDDIHITTVYSPEHGFAGTAEAGEEVGDHHQKNGPGRPPIVSLYGERKAPTAKELRRVNAFVVDLQDAGARYYTYPGTLKACMQSCVAAGVPMIILDRPNPAGGLVLEGPVARRHNALVCWGPVPARHGLTLGEITLFLRDTFFPKLQIEVITLDAWHPKFMAGQCALPWVPPSPNLPTPTSALLYTGMCLFEGTNLNEGRGTETPFQRIGAPWLDAGKVISRVEEECLRGCALSATTYTPHSIPGKATTPRYLDTPCAGISIEVTAPGDARPFSLAVSLLRAMQNTHPRELELSDYLDTLAGGPWVREQVLGRGRIAAAIEDLAPELAAFDQRRPKLYASEDV
ncbi:MAG: DUF1343 domain-containing protein [Candidatus Hydrogenedentes bacterium]|nr:DUF1343 domain-containing protein [Candidatus Hydrogenedentota bacterium]